MVTVCSGSAIPMWEFLARDEKMSHLYSMFAKDVSKYCRSNAGSVAITKCKHDLLTFGVAKLEKMEDSHLDAMDPFQRSANDIIWDAIMDGHPMMQPKKQPAATSEQAPILLMSGPFERNPLFDGIDEIKLKKNAVRTTTSNYAMDMEFYNDNRYDEPTGNQFPLATNVQLQYDVPSVNEPSTNYLTGPMVIRVRPDGSPVEEDRSRPLPRDDDIESMTSSGYFPSVRQLSQNLQPPAMPKVNKSFVPNTALYTNYRTISRRQQH